MPMMLHVKMDGGTAVRVGAVSPRRRAVDEAMMCSTTSFSLWRGGGKVSKSMRMCESCVRDEVLREEREVKGA